MSKTALHYGAGGTDRLYARIWGDSIHFGYYTDEEMDLEAATYETKRRMADIADVRSNTKILEVASGWGATARYLSRAHAAQVMATNVEIDHLEMAQVLTDHLGLNQRITHEYADYHALPFDPDTFDIWWCQEATVHARDKRQVFSEAYRVLKSSGIVVFTDQTTRRTDCSDNERTRLSLRHGSDDLFGSEDFLDVLESVGFQGAEFTDWSDHMARHFANLVHRIEHTYDELARDIEPTLIDANLSLWQFGCDLTRRGSIGWGCFAARKP